MLVTVDSSSSESDSEESESKSESSESSESSELSESSDSSDSSDSDGLENWMILGAGKQDGDQSISLNLEGGSDSNAGVSLCMCGLVYVCVPSVLRVLCIVQTFVIRFCAFECV